MDYSRSGGRKKGVELFNFSGWPSNNDKSIVGRDILI